MKEIIFLLLFSMLGISPMEADSRKKSSNIVLSHVMYLHPTNYEWTGPVDIRISEGKIESIQKSVSFSKAQGYLTPSFCDARVTLGADSLGGASNLQKARLALKSFIFHGFTHILSYADSPWVSGLKQEIDSGKIVGPSIYLSGRPILKKTKEYDLPSEIYYTAETLEELEKELQNQSAVYSTPSQIIHRYYSENLNYIESYELNRLLEIGKSKNRKISVSTFADRVSILDSLLAGVQHLEHPIPWGLNSEIKPQHIQKLYWIPQFGLYRNLVLEKSPEKMKKELSFLKEKSSFFGKYFFESGMNQILDSEIDSSAVSQEYQSYMQFLKEHPELYSKMILGSGSGHKFAFPGISGLQELGILLDYFKSPAILKIPTENTCAFLGVEKTGKIQIGWEANLILFKEDPTLKYSSLFAIGKVYQKGQEISFEK
jgi:hypothetical protein